MAVQQLPRLFQAPVQAANDGAASDDTSLKMLTSIDEGISSIDRGISSIDVGIAELNSLQRDEADQRARQAAADQQSFNDLDKTLTNIDVGIAKINERQEAEIQERAQKAVADEEAAMEARNDLAPLKEIDQSLKDIKKILSDGLKEGGLGGEGGKGKGGGVLSSMLGGLAALAAGAGLAKGGGKKTAGGGGGGWGLGRILKATAGASLGSLGGGALGEMLGGETGKMIGEVAGGALGAIGLSGIGRKPTPTVPSAPVPVAQPPLTTVPPPPAPTAPVPAPQAPVPPKPAGGMTAEQKTKYEELRKQGVPAAEAKERATKSGFERYVAREQAIQGVSKPTPTPTISPTPPTVATPVPGTPVPGAPTPTVPTAGAPTPTAPTPGAPTPPGVPTPTPAGKPSLLGRIASVGGKAIRAVPVIGQVAAAGMAAYETGKAAMNAEEVLGIKGREATWGERAAAGVGGLAESVSFGILSKEKTAGLVKAATGAGSGAEAAAATPSAAPTPPPVAPAAAPVPATKPTAPTTAPSTTGTALEPPTTKPQTAVAKPKAMISGEQDIKNMIIKHEGIRYEPYKDSLGLWTVGVGHLIGDGKSLPPEWNRKFSHGEVMAMFEEDYAHHKKAAEKIPGFSQMNKFGQGALTDLTFNMGPAWINKWPKLKAQLGASDAEGAASNLEGSKWYKQVKSRGPTIVSMVRAGFDGQAQPTATPTATPSATMAEAPKPAATAVAAPAAAPAAQPVTTSAGGQLTTQSGTAVTTESGVPVTTGTAAPMAAPQGAMAPRGNQIGRMSEQTAQKQTVASAPIVVNNNNSPTTVTGGGNGGRGMPSPYADRGSLATSTSFVAAA